MLLYILFAFDPFVGYGKSLAIYLRGIDANFNTARYWQPDNFLTGAYC